MASFSGAQLAMGTTVDEPQMFGPSQKKMVDPDGTVAISGTRPSTKDLEELDRLGAKVEGRLSVSVPMGARVVRHNAQSEPSFWGLFGAYNWEIKSPGANPLIVVHLSS